MTDYTKLVEALRYCGNFTEREGCDESCEYFNDMDCPNRIMSDAAAAIEALQVEVKRLEPKQRKLGRWEKAKPKGVVVYSDGYAECSSCHEVIWLGWGMNFCPHCGTQNKIIDPDDYDGAKMNDSNASNESNALGNAQDGPIITPCRGCSDYDGYGGCKSKGGCARARMEVQE